MSRSEQIQPIPAKYLPLTQVKRGNHVTRLPKLSAQVNAALARRAVLMQGGGDNG